MFHLLSTLTLQEMEAAGDTSWINWMEWLTLSPALPHGPSMASISWMPVGGGQEGQELVLMLKIM